MRGLLRAISLLAPALTRGIQLASGEDAIPSALITLLPSCDRPELTFRLDVNESKDACGYANLTINGETLPQGGDGLVPVDQDVTVIAHWNIVCVMWDGKPQEQLLNLTVDSVDGESVQNLGFLLRFQQVAPVWISDIEGPATLIRVHSMELMPVEDDEPVAEDPDSILEQEIAELQLLRDQIAMLDQLIDEKESHLAEAYGWADRAGSISACDSLKCVVQTIYAKVSNAAMAVYDTLSEGDDEETFGGKPGGPHRRPGFRHRPRKHHHKFPHWFPHHGNHSHHHHGNHTHGNHTSPHPPWRRPHHPFPHRPFHPPPFCRCPPHHPPHKKPDHPPPHPHPRPPHKKPDHPPHKKPDHPPPGRPGDDEPPTRKFPGKPPVPRPWNEPAPLELATHEPDHDSFRQGLGSLLIGMMAVFFWAVVKILIIAFSVVSFVYIVRWRWLRKRRSHARLRDAFRQRREAFQRRRAARRVQCRGFFARIFRKRWCHDAPDEKGPVLRPYQDEAGGDEPDHSSVASEISSLRNAAEMVGEMVAAEEGRSPPPARPYRPATPSSLGGGDGDEALPAYEYASSDAQTQYTPSTGSDSQSVVADGYGYTPGSGLNQYTPSGTGSTGSLGADDVLGDTKH